MQNLREMEKIYETEVVPLYVRTVRHRETKRTYMSIHEHAS